MTLYFPDKIVFTHMLKKRNSFVPQLDFKRLEPHEYDNSICIYVHVIYTRVFTQTKYTHARGYNIYIYIYSHLLMCLLMRIRWPSVIPLWIPF